jgi:hypothetical protein
MTDDPGVPGPPVSEPHFTVVRGQPDAAELAALTAVLLTVLARPHGEPPRRPRAPWAHNRRRFRPPAAWSAPHEA